MPLDLHDIAFIAASSGIPKVDFQLDPGYYPVNWGEGDKYHYIGNNNPIVYAHIYNPGTGGLLVTSVSLVYTLHVYGGGASNDVTVTNYNFSGVIPPGGSVALAIGVTWHWDEDCSWTLTVNSNAKTIINNVIPFQWISW